MSETTTIIAASGANEATIFTTVAGIVAWQHADPEHNRADLSIFRQTVRVTTSVQGNDRPYETTFCIPVKAGFAYDVLRETIRQGQSKCLVMAEGAIDIIDQETA